LFPSAPATPSTSTLSLHDALPISDTPIIFLTAKDTVEETIFGLQAGANDYLKKPFNFDELVERIKVQLRSKVAVLEKLCLGNIRSEEHTSELQSRENLVCRLLLEK